MPKIVDRTLQGIIIGFYLGVGKDKFRTAQYFSSQFPKCNICQRTIYKLLKQVDLEGTDFLFEPRSNRISLGQEKAIETKIARGILKWTPERKTKLREIASRNPQASGQQVAELLYQQCGFQASKGAVNSQLKRMKLKRRAVPKIGMLASLSP